MHRDSSTLQTLGCLVAASLLLTAALSPAQMNMSVHTMETRDEVPPDELPVPQMMTGTGNSQMDITATPEAQRWFNQGLNLLHDFWDYESARAFEQGVRVDPQCAMCYWGLYKAESFYHSTAQGYAGQALAKAVTLKDRASERERFYIEASAAHEQAMKSRTAGPIASSELEIWRKLVKAYPTDVQARIFLAQASDRKEGTEILKAILKDEPENSAANHYYIHNLEGSEHPELALGSAEILASLAPASGHMVHMPGHIFFRLGDYARAEHAFAHSIQVDERYMREQHVDPDNDWNYVHNLMYAIANLMEEGKLREAGALSAKLTGARGELESTLYIYSTRDSISRLHPRLPVALRTADWAQVLRLIEASNPPASLPNLQLLAHQLKTFAIGMQACANGDIRKAEESSTRFDAELWRMSQQSRNPQGMQIAMGGSAPVTGTPTLQVMPDALLRPLISSLSIMSLELRAGLLAVQGKTGEAKDLFARAAQEEKGLGYHEPPNYIRPVAETEGAAMMAVNHWADAKAAYGRALLERPRSGFVLFGLAMSSEKSGDSKAASGDYADFLAAWKDADPALPQLTHAKAYLAAHRSRAANSGPKRMDPLRLWPGTSPGDAANAGPERETPAGSSGGLVAGRPIIRLGNISTPTLTVFKPPAAKDTGAAALVFPGGGYSILALDLEGSEVCEWLNTIGVTGILVKYRVPAQQNSPRKQAPLQDAQRAISLVRHHAREWNIDPARIGVIGFSAGGHLAANFSNNYEPRTYSPIDGADTEAARPDFTMLIYPAYLVDAKDDTLAPEMKVSAKTPPTFLVQAENDGVRVENSLVYYEALRRAKVPAEMHLFSEGGHGYGLRDAGLPINDWPLRAAEWLRHIGMLNKHGEPKQQ